MAKLFRALVALAVLTGSQSFAAANPFPWKNSGGDPCNPKVGCTLAEGLARTGWPDSPQRALIVAVSEAVPREYTVHAGWRGWMTWGKFSFKFHPDTIAAWAQEHTEPAELWTIDYDGWRYHVIRVAKCRNWGGWVEELPKPAPTPKPAPVNQNPIPAPAVDLMPLGPRYIASCD